MSNEKPDLLDDLKRATKLMLEDTELRPDIYPMGPNLAATYLRALDKDDQITFEGVRT